MKFPTITLDDLKQGFRETSDGDHWGNAMMWLFDLASVLYERPDHDWTIINELRYGTGMLGNHVETSEESSAIWWIKRASTDDLIQFARMLDRLTDILKARGLAY